MITIKNIETEEPIYKARYVMHGQKDREKNFLVYDSTTVCQSSIRMLVSIATIFGFRFWSQISLKRIFNQLALFLDMFTSSRRKSLRSLPIQS